MNVIFTSRAVVAVSFGRRGSLPDHVLREVDDPHRLAHVEHEHLAAAANRARLHDERDGLRNRHEVPSHVRMGHGHGSAALDLLAENRDHAP
jgi:hypothetical protein